MLSWGLKSLVVPLGLRQGVHVDLSESGIVIDAKMIDGVKLLDAMLELEQVIAVPCHLELATGAQDLQLRR